jgi:hypothetical protein
MAYRPAANEKYVEKNGFARLFHRKKPNVRPMPEAIRRAYTVKSKTRSHAEHVFAEQKDRMGPFLRTIGIVRSTVRIKCLAGALQSTSPKRNRRAKRFYDLALDKERNIERFFLVSMLEEHSLLLADLRSSRFPPDARGQ